MSGTNRPATPEPAGPVLITGGAGFVGCNLADRIAGEGHEVRVLDNLARDGAAGNLAWLRSRHGARIVPIVAGVEEVAAVADAVDGVAAVMHLAAQVAVTTSLADPMADFATNLTGTLVLLEAVRRQRRPIPFVFASTNKVYGDLTALTLVAEGGRWQPADAGICRHGVGEAMPLALHTPYGCSKGAADQYVLDYARCFGLPATVLRKSCIFGRRQRGSEDQGWVAHFARAALAGDHITIYGDGRQVRDLLDVDDCVDAYVAAWRHIGRLAGRALNVGGGPGNAVALIDVVDALGEITGRRPALRFAPWRASDQRWYVSDTRAASAALDLAPPRPWREGLARLLADLAGDAAVGGGAARARHGAPARGRNRDAAAATPATGVAAIGPAAIGGARAAATADAATERAS